jgi:cytoskeletal protein CcmA (bactofilin family)
MPVDRLMPEKLSFSAGLEVDGEMTGARPLHIQGAADGTVLSF